MIGTQRLKWLNGLIVVAVAAPTCLTGCSSLASPSALTLPPGVIPSPTATTLSTTLIPTPHPASIVATLSPTRTPALPTVTPRPTLTADQERAFVVEMLETNGGCELPCWWGITLGETTWQTIKDHLGLYGEGFSQPGGVHYQTSYGGTLGSLLDYYIDLTFVERDRVIRSIQVMSEVFGDGASENFASNWHRYSPDQVLNRHGEPSQVYIQLVPPIERDAPVYYQLWLVYDHLGFYIVYTGPAVYEPPIMRACLRFDEVTAIALRLQSPRPGESVLESPELLRTLEEATGMDVETFYETFRNADSDVCLESPASIWP